MEDKCKDCSLLCKRMDGEDCPVRYTFSRLTPQEIITLVEGAVNRASQWHHLQVKQHEHSLDGHLVMLLKVLHMPSDAENQLLLIAHATKSANQSQLCFYYVMPDKLCQQELAHRFSLMVSEVLRLLEQSEWLLSKCASSRPAG